MVVNWTSAGFPAAGYPSRPHGKLISGKYARRTSVEIHRKGAPARASPSPLAEISLYRGTKAPFSEAPFDAAKAVPSLITSLRGRHCDNRSTIQVNKPIEQPQTVAIRRSTPQPAMTDMPP